MAQESSTLPIPLFIKKIKSFVQRLATSINQMNELEVLLAILSMAQPALAHLREEAPHEFEVFTGGNPLRDFI